MMEKEGHLNWIRKLVHESSYSDEELKSYCVQLLNEKVRQTPSRCEDRNEWSTIIAEKLNFAALSILAGNKKNATEDSLKKLDELLHGEMKKCMTESQREVILYCRDVLRWQNDGAVDSTQGMKLDRRWGIMADWGGKEEEALINYLKGSLGLMLKVRDCVVRNYYFEAWDLDPKCLTYYHHSYRMVRKIRIEKGGHDQVPDHMERYFAEKAHQLCDGKNITAAADYGLMLKETLKKHCNLFWRDFHSAFVKVLENELRTAQGDYRMKIRIRVAEFLFFGEGPTKDQQRGREMFSELERDYPNTSKVMQKVGNVYRMEKDFDRARKCYKKALELEPTGVPCIMDYLKLLKSNKNFAEIVRVLKNALTSKSKLTVQDYTKLNRELLLAIQFTSTIS